MFDASCASMAVLQENGRLYSPYYNDIYFSDHGAVDESRYVFLQGNRLAERFAGNQGIVIGEIGFGTGLNFLLTWQLWCEYAPEGASLIYIAIENQPLPSSTIQKALEIWPELAGYLGSFLEKYPRQKNNADMITFHWDNVRLELHIGEASKVLADVKHAVDAWFLDGFAPAKNPQAWSSEVCSGIGQLSNLGATFSTYTAAGMVKRNLQAVGFDIQRTQGFKGKRHMLKGVKR